MENHKTAFIKLLVKLLHLCKDQNETTSDHRWKKTDFPNRVAFHQGGVVADLCGETCSTTRRIQVCV